MEPILGGFHHVAQNLTGDVCADEVLVNRLVSFSACGHNMCSHATQALNEPVDCLEQVKLAGIQRNLRRGANDNTSV